MKINTHTLTLIGCALGLANANALEPLTDGTAGYVDRQAKRLLNKLDTNKDGKVQKVDNEKLWKRYGRYDKDKDGVLNHEEAMNSLSKAMDTPGKELMNVCYKQVDGRKLYMDFYFPDEDTKTDKPVVVFTHGGGWAAGSKDKAGTGSFAEVHKALLKEGFCVMSAGYRLVNKGANSGMRDCVIDAKDAVRFISAHKKELGIDPSKIYTFGDSAGGQMAQMVLLASPDSLKGDPELAEFSYKTVAGVSWYGPCDFQDISLFNHDDRDNFKDRFGARIMGGGAKAEDKEKLYKEMSPVSYLTKESPPLLMIQGDKDTTIPVKQAYRMQEELKTVPAPVEIMIVKNAGHNWRSVDAPIEPTRAEIVQKTIEFFLKHK
ncbi:MAG: prolyl oligopeptidase family serine peptidase [Akkermansiaceae bacterium]